jgi:hypothetical protein
MHKNSFPLAVIVVCGIFPLQQSVGGPLTSAQVTKIINRVSVIDPEKGSHPAIIRETIKDDLGLQTGEKSRSELLFQDNTLTRIGAETYFSFKTGTRDLTLERGSMLLQVPKGLGGAKIHTAAVTAAITGTTIMMQYVPRQYIKVIVLEGSLRLSRNGTFDSIVLRPGKMVIMRPDANNIPEPIDIDLRRIVSTSILVNFPDARAPLPSMTLIQAAINDQAKQLAKGDLARTDLFFVSGTKVVAAANGQMTKNISALEVSVANGAGSVANLNATSATMSSDANAAAKMQSSGNRLPTISPSTVPTPVLPRPLSVGPGH